jgi:hypothetical protein
LFSVTLYEYIVLDLNDKANILWENGIFLESHLETNRGFNLYYLHNYYVEVTVSKPSEEIIDIMPFKQGHRREKYLNKIEI